MSAGRAHVADQLAARGLHPIWVLPVLLLMAMSVTGILGVTLERFAYRPLYTRGATRLGPLISAVGASIFLQNAVMLTQGARMKVYMTEPAVPPQLVHPGRQHTYFGAGAGDDLGCARC